VRRIGFFFIVSMLFPLGALGAGEWAPVSQADWDIGIADSLEDENAVILFERVTVDDRQADRNLYSTTIYRRVKILNPRGYGWADVTVPYLHKKQKVKEMKGRTLWRDGRIFVLDKKQIFQSDLISAKKLAVKQKAFSLPAIQDGCIIETSITLESPVRTDYLIAQKELPILNFELLWYYYTLQLPGGMVFTTYEINKIAKEIPQPMILAYNMSAPVAHYPKTEMNPLSDCIKIVVGNLPAHQSEPLMINKREAVGAIALFYDKGSTDFWSEFNRELWDGVKNFGKSHKRFDEQYRSFSTIADKKEYLHTVYEWIRKNIKNSDWIESEMKFKSNESVDDVLNNGYGNSYDINALYYHFLRRHGFKPEFALVADRRERIVDEQLHDWQFDNSAILIPGSRGRVDAYMPGTPWLLPGQIPYYYEGSKAFAVDSTVHAWRSLAFSGPHANTFKRTQNLHLSDDGLLTGTFVEQSDGQYAWLWRLMIAGEDSTTAVELIRNELQSAIPLAKIDSIRFTNVEVPDNRLTISCKMSFPPLARRTEQDHMLQLSDYIGHSTNPLVAETRSTQILLDHSFTIDESIQLRLSQAWHFRSAPARPALVHLAGKIESSTAEQGGLISSHRHVQISRPLWAAKEYNLVQHFFQNRALLNNELIVLQKK